MTTVQAEPRPRKLTFDDFWEVTSQVNIETNLVTNFVKRALDYLTDHHRYRWVKTTLIGSARVRVNSPDDFYAICKWSTKEEVRTLLRSSDVDVCGDFDTFLLEELQIRVPELVEKQATNEDGEYQTKVLLRSVHECTFGDLVKGFPVWVYEKAVQDTLMYHLGVNTLSQDNLDKIVVQLLSVKSVKAVDKIWGALDTRFFVRNLWKKSPSYIGREYVQQFFNTLEKVALKEDGPTHFGTSSALVDVVPAWDVPVEGIPAGNNQAEDVWELVDDLLVQPNGVVGVPI